MKNTPTGGSLGMVDERDTDGTESAGDDENNTDDGARESRDKVASSPPHASVESDASDSDVSDSVREEMDRFTHEFPGLKQHYKVLNKIGEGKV